MTNLAAPVPVLDLDDFRIGGSHAESFVEDLARTLKLTGFFYLRNHGVDLDAITKVFDLLPSFFNLPVSTKLKYEYPEIGRQWGYTPLDVETGEYAKVPDHKEFFHINQDKMVEVPDVPGFTPANQALFWEFNRTYTVLMQAVALSLQLDKHFFGERVGNSLLRVIHYPPQDDPQSSDARVESLTPGGNVSGMCASRHTDINVLTLLLARTRGLQLLHGGQWLPMLISDPTVLIVNSGDMLEHLTGGRYLSGQHRVVCERNVPRFSMPFFGHVHQHVSLVPLAHLGESDTNRFRYSTAGEFLMARLEQIGLLSKK